MAAHQRASLVTVLAILMHVLSRYAKVKRASASSWANAGDALIGHEALRITAPHDEVAFLQSPTSVPKSQQSIEAADLLLPNVEHEVKRTWAAGRAETTIFALIGSLSRPNVKDHRSSTRTGLCGTKILSRPKADIRRRGRNVRGNQSGMVARVSCLIRSNTSQHNRR